MVLPYNKRNRLVCRQPLEYKMNRKNYLYLLLVIVSAFFVSCNENTIFNEYTTVDNGVWAKDRSFAFNVEVSDTTALYEIDLLVRNIDIFPRQNL